MTDNNPLVSLTSFRAFLVFDILMGLKGVVSLKMSGLPAELLGFTQKPYIISQCLHTFFPLFLLLIKKVEEISSEQMKKKIDCNCTDKSKHLRRWGSQEQLEEVCLISLRRMCKSTYLCLVYRIVQVMNFFFLSFVLSRCTRVGLYCFRWLMLVIFLWMY